MKYVIYKHKSGCIMPVIMPDHVTHSTVTIEECKPISAGFFYLSDDGITIQDGESTSLGLGPDKERDFEYLGHTLTNSGIYAFIEY